MDKYIKLIDICEANDCFNEKHDCDNCVFNKIPAADVQPVDRWINVDEALPNSGETVLIYYNNQFYIAKYNGDFAETMPWSSSGHWWGKELISFWQPLPEPPVLDER